MSSKKRSRSSSERRNATSVFDTLQHLESEDVRAERKRRTTTSTTDLCRSKAAQSQTKIHGHLMECRILLQRSLTAATTTTTGSNHNGDNDDDDNKETAKEACNQLLVQLLEARKQLISSTSSDDDFNDKEHTNEYNHLVQNSSSSDLEEVLQSEYETCRERWKEVLNRRHKDLRLHAGLTTAKNTQFRVMDSTFWQQVEATVSHEQLRRMQQQQSDETTSNNNAFDDSKLYQHMLKDFLVSAGNGAGGAEEAAAQRLKRAIKTKSSKKKTVDRRASKGRKMRYMVVPKLVNFTFPVSRPNTVSGMDEDEWFKSLFGGAGHNNKKA